MFLLSNAKKNPSHSVKVWQCLGLTLLLATSALGFLAIHSNSYVEHSQESPSPLYSTGSIKRSDLQVELFIHPECSCTHRSLVALEKLQNQFPDLPAVKLYVASYSGGNLSDWRVASNYKAALKIAKTTIVEDPEATLAKRAGALASGTLCIRDRQGMIIYLGGLTDSRSCDVIGPNYLAIREFLANHYTSIDHSRVYGCHL